MMSQRMFLLLNICCFIFLFLFLISFRLSLFPLILAIAIMIANIYNAFKAALPSPPVNTLFQNEGKADVVQFEKKVRMAYEQSMCRQAEKCRGQEYFWSKSHARQSQAIEDLRKYPLSEEYKSRKEMMSLREQGSSAKKVRTFFQERDEGIDERLRERIAEAVERASAQESKKDGRKQRSAEALRQRANNCLKALSQFINGKLQREMDTIIEDFQAADRFLSRCFSITLTLQRPNSQAISPNEFIELVSIIERKQMLPSRFTTSLTFAQVAAELANVRDSVIRLPNFALGASVLRMVLALKFLKSQFAEESIVLAGFFKQEQKSGEVHIVRLQEDDRFYYNRQPQVKSKHASVVSLMIVLHLIKKYHRSNPLVRNIYAQISSQHGIMH